MPIVRGHEFYRSREAVQAEQVEAAVDAAEAEAEAPKPKRGRKVEADAPDAGDS